jgi:hypothetical protein
MKRNTEEGKKERTGERNKEKRNIIKGRKETEKEK